MASDHEQDTQREACVQLSPLTGVRRCDRAAAEDAETASALCSCPLESEDPPQVPSTVSAMNGFSEYGQGKLSTASFCAAFVAYCSWLSISYL